MATSLIFNASVRTSPEHPEASIVDVEGEIDVLTSPRLKSALAALVDGGSSLVVVNLAQVKYMDSTGLGVLVSAMKRIREKNGTIVLSGLNSHLSKIFEITGLRKVFEVYPTEDDALNAGPA
jgi:anti-sigma B factor antagonist